MDFKCINDDNNLMLKGFKFRYEVFCLEKKHFNKNNYENFCETDIYDNASLHFAAIDCKNQVIGYVRLICDSDYGFPIERRELNTDFLNHIGSKSRLAEVSRLAIRRECRKYWDDCYSYHIQLGLYRMAYLSGVELGITHICAIMEKPLYRSLSRMSFNFNAIGSEFDDHGEVAPYLADISDVEDTLFQTTLQNVFFNKSGLQRYDTKFVFWGRMAA